MWNASDDSSVTFLYRTPCSYFSESEWHIDHELSVAMLETRLTETETSILKLKNGEVEKAGRNRSVYVN